MALAPGSTGYRQPRAAWRVTLDGLDLTQRLAPILVSLRLSERSGEEADELEIVLDDSAQNVALPPEGAVLHVALGWERGTDVPLGLVSKGSFTVDEVSWSGPPDQVAIRARSANLAGSYRRRENRVWQGMTLGAIVQDIASAQGLTPRCHAALQETAIAAAEQAGKSPMQFLRDLGRRYDATASVKGGALIFAPRAAQTTATGAAIPAQSIARSQCVNASWRRAARSGAQDGAEAQWHDGDAATRKTVTVGGENRKRLKKVYASEADARAAAQAEAARLGRATATLDLDLAFGDPRLAPGMRITATGFKPGINGSGWLIATADHAMDDRGLSTRLSLET